MMPQPGAGAPPPAPPPMQALAGARPPGPPPMPGGAGGGMSASMLQFLAGVGFKTFTETLKKLRGDDKKGAQKSPAGGLIQNLANNRAMPQNAMTPGGQPGMPPMLQGGQSPGFLAMLAKLAAMTQGRGGQ